VYIADYLEWLYYTGKPSKYYKGKEIPLRFFKDMLVALKRLYVKIKNLNEHGYFHNDIQQENIIYDEFEKKAYVIDFERLSMQPLHLHLTDMINMQDLIDTLTKYINGIEFSMEDKRIGGTKKYKKIKRKNRLTRAK
jgi:thiamine kinase-like enzyme